MLLFVWMSKSFMRRLNNFCPTHIFCPKDRYIWSKNIFLCWLSKSLQWFQPDLPEIKVRFLNNYIFWVKKRPENIFRHLCMRKTECSLLLLPRRLIRSSRPIEIFQPPQQGFFSVHAQLQVLGKIVRLLRNWLEGMGGYTETRNSKA